MSIYSVYALVLFMMVQTAYEKARMISFERRKPYGKT